MRVVLAQQCIIKVQSDYSRLIVIAQVLPQVQAVLVLLSDKGLNSRLRAHGYADAHHVVAEIRAETLHKCNLIKINKMFFLQGHARFEAAGAKCVI